MWEMLRESKIDRGPRDLQRDSEIETAAEEKAAVLNINLISRRVSIDFSPFPRETAPVEEEEEEDYIRR